MRTLAFVQIQEWNFRQPVFIGDTVRVRVKVAEKLLKARGRRGQISWHRQIVNHEGKVVQEGTTVTLVEVRGEKKDQSGEANAE